MNGTLPMVTDRGGEAADQAVAWSTSNAAVATVDAASGVVSGVSTGTAAITAKTANGFSGSATINVVGPSTSTDATVSIASVTTGNLGTPVTLNNVKNQIDVSLNVDPAQEQVSRVELLVDGDVVASQAIGASAAVAQDAGLSLSVAAKANAASAQLVAANAVASIVLSFNTADFDRATGAVSFENGQHKISARLVTAAGSPVATNEITLNFNNANTVIGSITTTPTNGQVATATDSTGLTWHAGDVVVTAIPVIYTPGRTFKNGTVVLSSGATKAITAAPATVTFPNDSSAAQDVANVTTDSLSATMNVVLDNGATITASVVNDPENPVAGETPNSPLWIRLDNSAPEPMGYVISTTDTTVNDQGSVDNWVGANYVFSDDSAKGVTQFMGFSIMNGSDGVGGNTTTFQFATDTAGPWTTITQGNSSAIAETSRNDVYVLRMIRKDALGNADTTVVGDGHGDALTFGVDKTAPTIAFASGSIADKGIVGVGDSVKVTITDPASGSVSGSGFLSSTPVRTTVVRAAPGVDGAEACVASTMTNGVCGSVMAPTSVAIGNADSTGYYTYTASVSDKAGNTSSTLTRVIAIDNDAPVVGVLSFSPAKIKGNGTVNFTTSYSDNLDAISGQLTIAYGDMAILYEPFTIGTGFDDVFTIEGSAAASIPKFIRGLEFIDALGVISDSTSADSAIVAVTDVAGNVSNEGVAAFAPANIDGAFKTFDNGTITSFAVASPSAASNISRDGKTTPLSSNPLTRKLTAELVGPSAGLQNPVFERVSFYALVGGRWEKLGDASAPAITDVSGTRTITYSFTWDARADFPETAGLEIRAIGVNAAGDGLATASNTNITVVK